MQQYTEQELILSNLKDGIIVIDTQNQISTINKSAVKLFELNISELQGKNIKTIIKNPDFCEFTENALVNSISLEKEFIVKKKNEIFIHTYSVPIYDKENKRSNTLIVLSDITRTKKLENIRKDFISNVSHELKTPITSIQGFVETLLEDDLDNPEEVKNFLQIIKKHTGRLKEIIESLLNLSRLEQEAKKKKISCKNTRIKDILMTAIQSCDAKAGIKEIKIKMDCNENILGNVNRLLIEQAVINLINNALEYSNEKGKILISGHKSIKETVICVEDNGCGIPKEHLSRIFERFYRVDKSRSRKFGGTGLGLAIVKHITQLHGGYIDVQSMADKGSSFYIHLPDYV